MSTHKHHHSAECKELLGQLGDYIDGELEAAICAEIENHLAQCDDCRVLVDTTRKTVLLYRHHQQENEVKLSPDITNRLWAALENEDCIPPTD